MALTKSFKELVQSRVASDPAFGDALLREGIDTLLCERFMHMTGTETYRWRKTTDINRAFALWELMDGETPNSRCWVHG